jgi:hypothetical protein
VRSWSKCRAPRSTNVKEGLKDGRRVDVNRRFRTDPFSQRSSADTYEQAKILVLSHAGTPPSKPLRPGAR